MSAQAKHFLRLWFSVLYRLENPSRNPQRDREIFEDEHRVRLLAGDLIGWGVSPTNEPMSGQPEAAATGRSAVLPSPIFRQAGVVAPPDSLMDEKARFELDAMGEAWESGRAEREADELVACEERYAESQLMSGDR